MSLLKPEHPFFVGIEPVDTIIDIGPGIAPVQFFETKKHICIEPYWRYAEILEAHGYEVILSDAYDALPEVEQVDSIFLLDVIEHMEKPVGQAVLEMCKKKVKKQIVVFTPNGFKEQTTDQWNLGGEYWQFHRSGWTRDDFSDWRVIQDHNSIFAVWSPS